ncbi:MAG: glycosyltransferase family 4 protein [Chthoniobacterales bacterium]
MKILTVCYEYPPVGGGGGNMARNIACGLALRGHEVKVQTVRLRGLARMEVSGGVEIRRSFGFRRRPDFCSVPEMAGYLAGAFFPAWKLAASWKPDVVHAHFAVPSGALALPLRAVTGVPYALTVHLGDLPGGNPDQTDRLFRLLNPFIRPVWRKAGGVSASSRFAAGLAKAAYGLEPEIIPNGISMAGRPPLAQPPGKVVRFVAIGRFNPQKNFPWMIRALARCEFPWTLDLIGGGTQEKEIRDSVAGTTTGDRVRFRGWLSEPEMRAVLSGSDIMLMPSTSEGNPVSAIEALKQGVAIVGSTTPGLNDLIADGANGYAVPVESDNRFVACLRDLAANPRKLSAMKTRSLELSRSFDIELIAGKFEQFLARVSLRR